jgi:hypothetical protein
MEQKVDDELQIQKYIYGRGRSLFCERPIPRNFLGRTVKEKHVKPDPVSVFRWNLLSLAQ